MYVIIHLTHCSIHFIDSFQQVEIENNVYNHTVVAAIKESLDLQIMQKSMNFTEYTLKIKLFFQV